jgi:hypothetical protein
MGRLVRTLALATVLVGMPSVGLPGADAFVLNAHPNILHPVRLAALARPPSCATGRPLLRRASRGVVGLLRMTEEKPDGAPADGVPEEPVGGAPPEKVEEVLDPSTRAARAGEIRKQASELDKEAGINPIRSRGSATGQR